MLQIIALYACVVQGHRDRCHRNRRSMSIEYVDSDSDPLPAAYVQKTDDVIEYVDSDSDPLPGAELPPLATNPGIYI